MFDDEYLRELDSQIKVKLAEGKIEEAEKLSAKLISVAEGTQTAQNPISIVSKFVNSVVSRIPSAPTSEQIAQIKAGAINEEHLRLLSLFHYINAGLIGSVSCIFLLYVFVGLAMVLNPAFFASAETTIASVSSGGWILSIMGLVPLLFGWGYAALNIAAGRCIRLRKRRVLCLIASGVNCLNVPMGTALGISSFIVLSKPAVKNMFDHHKQPEIIT